MASFGYWIELVIIILNEPGRFNLFGHFEFEPMVLKALLDTLMNFIAGGLLTSASG